MRPGLILVQHAKLPDRSTELVRGDITGVIGFIPPERWPAESSAGDFVEIVVRRYGDFWAHPDRVRFAPRVTQAVRAFFENGGDIAHVLGVCIASPDDLLVPASALGVLSQVFDRLRAEDDIALLIAPELADMECSLNRDGSVRWDAETLYDELLRHCREMSNRFVIMDPPKDLHGDLLLSWTARYRDRYPETRSHGAMYYPWLMRGDERFPPSGAVAGLFARVETEHRPFGVVWPPANVVVSGVTHTEVELNWDEAGLLAEASVNPIVIQGGRGVVVFGARTLSKDPAFVQINSRRIVSMVSEQLRRDNEWAVFETNNPHLWAVLQRDVRFRLSQFWNAGLLAGAKDAQEYDVKCDGDINPPVTREAGIVNVQVLLRPVGTTEQIRVDLRIGDDAGEP